MKRIIISIIMMFFILLSLTGIYAVTKDDIIGYVNSQSVCGDMGLFNSYKSTFTRLLKQKKLTNNQLASIYSYLQRSVGILNSKGVCRLSDLDKLTEKEKNSVYNNLMTGASIITNAPKLTFDERNHENNSSKIKQEENKEDANEAEKKGALSKEDKATSTNVVLNTETGTIDIYENGVLLDKISMFNSKMTYTGVNIQRIIIIIACMFIFTICFVVFIILYNRHTAKNRFVKNILVSVMIYTLGASVILIMFGTKLDSLKGAVNLISLKLSNEEYDIELNEDKTIKTYPSYGLNYGTLKVQRLGIERNIYFGDSADILSIGIGHSTWSEMPTEGGIVVLSGHNNKESLNNIKNIKTNDKITVDTTYAKCVYSVKETKILNDTEMDKLAKQDNKETLILYTCYPFDTYVYSEKRFVVFAILENIEWK